MRERKDGKKKTEREVGNRGENESNVWLVLFNSNFLQVFTDDCL